jgi:fumarate reductase subunit C
MSVWWWLKKPAYARFVLRELTSVFVAFFALLYLWQLRALAEGPDAYARVIARLQTPQFLALNGIALALVLFHTCTWFNAAPAAMVARVRGKRVPAEIIVGSQYVAWVLVSGIIAWIFTRG